MKVTDEMVKDATMTFFMQMAGDALDSNDSIDAWFGCMRKALEAALGNSPDEKGVDDAK